MKRFVVAGLLLAACLLPLPMRSVEAGSTGEKFSALALIMSGAGAGANRTVTIYVNSYTSDEDAKVFRGAFLDGGQDALTKVLQKAKTIGRVSVTGRVGAFELKLIRQFPLPDGGRRIIGVSDRPIGFLEAYNQGRSTDYTIGLIQIDLKADEKGREKGQGALIYAAKVEIKEGNTLEIENYGIEPIRLNAVRKL